jgi:extracellular solute-binding protein (family 5)
LPEKPTAVGVNSYWWRFGLLAAGPRSCCRALRYEAAGPEVSRRLSFECYRGVSAQALKDRVCDGQVVDPRRVRFHLKEPCFLTFYATPATSAAWIVPSKYVQKVGDERFKKLPVGAGPYRSVSFTPGVELVRKAHVT